MKIAFIRDYKIFMVSVIAMVLVSSLLMIGNVLAQKTNILEDEPSDKLLPRNMSDSDQTENKTSSSLKTSKKSNLISNSPNIAAPNTVTCSSSSNPCTGTNGDDYMVGDSGFNNMRGEAGQDTMVGGAGDDGMTGGTESDIILGNSGSDIIMGLDGNDILFHSDSYRGTSDSSRDLIYCGDGYDEVWVDRVTDNDAAYDCEVIHEKDESINLDIDNDSVPNRIDNCPTVSNNSQMDRDKDGLGDPCDPHPFDSRLRESKVTVRFDSITVHKDRENAARGSGEWDLAAYVQGHRVMLTDATSNIVCQGSGTCFELWFVEEGKIYRFDRGTEITIEIPETYPLSIFTAGSEVDDCGRDTFPTVIPNVVISDRPLDTSRITQMQNEINSWTPKCLTGDAMFPGSDNDILGLVNQGYALVPGTESYQVKSSNGDFTLQYTIGIKPPINQ